MALATALDDLVDTPKRDIDRGRNATLLVRLNHSVVFDALDRSSLLEQLLDLGEREREVF